MKCLHDRARGIISTQDNLQKKVDYLAKVLKQNGYPTNFIHNASPPPTQETEETTVLDHGRGQELMVKEALHIQMTPVEEHFNRDGGLEVPGCWTAVMRRQGGREEQP